MAIIRSAMLTIRLSFSYVLIITTPPTRLGAGGSTSPGCLGKYIIINVRFSSLLTKKVLLNSEQIGRGNYLQGSTAGAMQSKVNYIIAWIFRRKEEKNEN